MIPNKIKFYFLFTKNSDKFAKYYFFIYIFVKLTRHIASKKNCLSYKNFLF